MQWFGTKSAVGGRWHELLTTRFVCEVCLTRYFVSYYCCPACQSIARIRPLTMMLAELARDETELRRMIAGGQIFEPVEEASR